MLMNEAYLGKAVFIVTRRVRCGFGIIGPTGSKAGDPTSLCLSCTRRDLGLPRVDTPARPQPPQTAQERALEAEPGLCGQGVPGSCLPGGCSRRGCRLWVARGRGRLTPGPTLRIGRGHRGSRSGLRVVALRV